MIYCDYNATAPLRPEAKEAMLDAMARQANPSSVHASGRAAKKCVEDSRSIIAGAMGVRASDIVFTSGGTEANGSALHGCLQAQGKPVLFYSDLEHPAVRDIALSGRYDVQNVKVSANGQLDLDDLESKLSSISEERSPVLTVMLANNETGVVQPVAEAAALVRAKNGFVHCDAVQALGKIAVNAGLLNVDMLSVSAHKLGGPQGCGAMWIAPGLPFKAQQIGGGQEQSRRSGTENMIGIAGFGAAVKAALADLDAAIPSRIRDAFEQALPKTVIQTIAADQSRLPNTSCIVCEGFKGETQVMALDLAGFAVSSGSACSSGKVRSSAVLASMGFNADMASCALRVSFGWNSELSDAQELADAWLKAAMRAVPQHFKEMA